MFSYPIRIDQKTNLICVRDAVLPLFKNKSNAIISYHITNFNNAWKRKRFLNDKKDVPVGTLKQVLHFISSITSPTDPDLNMQVAKYVYQKLNNEAVFENLYDELKKQQDHSYYFEKNIPDTKTSDTIPTDFTKIFRETLYQSELANHKLQEKLSVQENQKHMLETEINQLRDSDSKKRRKIEHLTSELARVKTKCNNVIRSKKTLNTELKTANIQLHDLNKKVDVHALVVDDFQNEIKHLKLECTDLDLEVKKLTHFCRRTGQLSKNLTELYHNPLTRALICDPNVTTHQVMEIHFATFMIFHSIAYHILKGYTTVFKKTIPQAELIRAIEEIMDFPRNLWPGENDLPFVWKKSFQTNHIKCYQLICRIAKRRRPSQYSTSMNLVHLFLYSRKLNGWLQNTLGLSPQVTYDSELELFYGSTVVSKFVFENQIFSDETESLVENEPEIVKILHKT